MNLLRDYIREHLKAEYRRGLLEEGKFQDTIDWINEKGKSAADATKDFFIKLKKEWGETKEGAKILAKMAKNEEISKEETTALKQQMKDVAIGTPLLALVILPGGGIATVALIKLAQKFGIDLTPSSFKEENNEIAT